MLRVVVPIAVVTVFAWSAGVGSAAADDGDPGGTPASLSSEPASSELNAADPPSAGPTATDPTPADPTPAEPTTGQPAPAEPAPAEPTETAPAEPTPAKPAPAEPAPVATGGAHAEAAVSAASVASDAETGLSVTGSVHPEFTRTYSWKLDKQIREVGAEGWDDDDTLTWTGDASSHPFEYRIVVSRTGSVDSDWTLVGSVSVHNDATDTEAPAVNAVVTQPTTLGGIAADCQARPAGSGSFSSAPVALSIGSGQSESVDVRCTFDAKPAAGSYAATVTSSVPVDQMGADAFAFTTPTTRIHAEVTAVDDRATTSTDDDVIYEPVTWQEACGCAVTVAHYTLVHVATTSGCTPQNTWTNTATLYDEDDVVLSTDSTTAAICVTGPPVTPPTPNPCPPAASEHPCTPPVPVVPEVQPPSGGAPPATEVLPNTGGPSWAFLYAGLTLAGLGGALVLTAQRRRRVA